jgi:hypothetical protein
MDQQGLILKWSKLTPLNKTEIEKITDISAVFRLSKKQPSDNKFYVFYVGSTQELKKELLKLISEDNDNALLKAFLKVGTFAFKYAEVKDEDIRKAVEKQMYKQYAPEFNTQEPNSPLDIKTNLN